MFTYKAMRHYAPIEARYETLDEAVSRAFSDIETNSASPVQVRDETGAVILSGDELHERAMALMGSMTEYENPDSKTEG